MFHDRAPAGRPAVPRQAGRHARRAGRRDDAPRVRVDQAFDRAGTAEIVRVASPAHGSNDRPGTCRRMRSWYVSGGCAAVGSTGTHGLHRVRDRWTRRRRPARNSLLSVSGLAGVSDFTVWRLIQDNGGRHRPGAASYRSRHRSVGTLDSTMQYI